MKVLLRMKRIVGHLIVLSLLCLTNIGLARAWDADRQQAQPDELQKVISIHSDKMPVLSIQRGMTVSLFWVTVWRPCWIP